jgi:hypothetical protein
VRLRKVVFQRPTLRVDTFFFKNIYLKKNIYPLLPFYFFHHVIFYVKIFPNLTLALCFVTISNKKIALFANRSFLERVFG